MQRRHRLTASADFQIVRQRGRSFASPSLVVYARPNADARSSSDLAPLRVGISVGKRYGSAVARNRFKRRIREIVRHRLDLLAPGWDLVFVARPRAGSASFGELETATETVLRRAGVLASRREGTGEAGK